MKTQSHDENKSVPLMLRLPPELHALVKEMAAKNRRSLNSQCIVLLEDGIAAQSGNQPPSRQNPT